MNTNIRFPKTNIVECVFCFRQSSNVSQSAYDEYDRISEDQIKRLKKYNYRVPESLRDQIHIGDAVLVHCKTGYQLCMVTGTNVITAFDEQSLAPVVCKCDLDSFWAEVDREQQLKVMHAQLVAEKKRLEALVTYELIAEKNPEFKELLEAFKSMGGEV